MNYLDLFSGIGGFALGAYNAGWRFDKHYFSEVDEYAIKVYQRRFPDAIPLGDITKIDCETLADSDTGWREDGDGQFGRQTDNWIITGGFPCQDISVAGKGAGIGGSRSGLWFAMWRLIRDLRPWCVIAENVGAITFRGLATVVNSLATIGYDAEWQDIRASDMGAPHRRERIWIVAYPSSERGWTQGETGLEVERNALDRRQRQEDTDAPKALSAEIRYPNKQREPVMPIDAEASRLREDVADTECCGRNAKENGGTTLCAPGGKESGQSKAGRIAETADSSSGREWRGNWWATEPDVGRVVNGIPSRVDRLKGLGNSIVPQIAELLFRRIDETQRI